MYESNRLKGVLLKDAPLVIGLLVLSSLYQVTHHLDSNISEVIFLVILSIVLFLIFFTFSPKIRNVAVGRTKLIIFKRKDQEVHSWLEVEEISFNRFTGLYKLRLKNHSTVYFATFGMGGSLLGDDSEMGRVISKKKIELDI